MTLRRSTLVFYKALLLLAIGSITVTVSEFWFYEVTDDTSSLFVLLTYGVVGYLSLLMLEKYSVQTFAGFFIVAAIFGWLIEGVLCRSCLLGYRLPFFGLVSSGTLLLPWA
jgi:hypothetical protein